MLLPAAALERFLDTLSEENRVPLNANREAMYALLDEAVAAPGLDPDGLELSESYESAMPGTDGGAEYLSFLTAANGKTNITVYADLTVYISFNTPVRLPVSFTYGSTSEECEAAGECVAGMFSELLGFENPRVSVSGGNYGYTGVQNYSVSIYDAGESDGDMLVNYSFFHADLYAGEHGGLYGIRIYRPDLSGKMGDYPIISVSEAEELLLNGGTLPATSETLRSEDIVGVELVYRISEYSEYFVPYYRFYMEAGGEMVPAGFTICAWYGVPAIEAQYIA